MPKEKLYTYQKVLTAAAVGLAIHQALYEPPEVRANRIVDKAMTRGWKDYRSINYVETLFGPKLARRGDTEVTRIDFIDLDEPGVYQADILIPDEGEKMIRLCIQSSLRWGYRIRTEASALHLDSYPYPPISISLTESPHETLRAARALSRGLRAARHTLS